jgi:DMSO/TMAO reductase YedYZ heme-binding membrane subunit
MGPKGWQQLHNTVYTITALALIHYLLSPEAYPEQYLMSGMFFWLMGWRGLNRHRRGTDKKALALLAVVSSPTVRGQYYWENVTRWRNSELCRPALLLLLPAEEDRVIEIRIVHAQRRSRFRSRRQIRCRS